MKTSLLAACVVAFATGKSAAAQDFTFQVEPTIAFWVDDPQANRFNQGLDIALRPGLALGRVVSLQGTYALLVTPTPDGWEDFGSAHFVMGGLRVRPFGALQDDSRQLGGLFVDGNIGYVRTGNLDRLGFDAGLGYDIQVAERFAVGPVLRYVQIVQPNELSNRNPNDAQLLSFGINMIWGSKPEEAVVATPSAPVYTPPVEVVAAPKPCSDRDRDGVCDADDRCPLKIGPPATFGCPIDPCGGTPLQVLVQFDYDSAAMPAIQSTEPQTMDPVLDAVADAIAQDKTCRVCIIGYASEEGAADYNLDLSRRRAAAVEDYMTSHGLAGRRMPTTGFGSACQMIPEASRTMNRRVEFLRLQDGESCPVDCPK